ncbi:MAG: prolipoprotein diacylglyceryl transferase [Gemmatimonadales bacterium]|nr:prolipoprotein diacylglyceryl transferase [Gemmatimonadales bacterium]
MYPELLGFIKSYGLMLATSFGLGMWLSVRRGRPYGLKPEVILDLVFGVLVSSLVGVRLLFVLTHLSQFHPWYHAFYIWDGGLTLYGGILLSIIVVWVMTRRRGIPFLVIADIFSPGVILGIGITRIGCFLAGCCFGRPTGCSCAVTFPQYAPASKMFGVVPVHPSQLYASAAGFLTFGLLLLMERWSPLRGATFGRFLVLYGVSRFVVDFSRYYEPEQIVMLGWSNNQWISLGFVTIGSMLLVLSAKGVLGGPWRAEDNA